MQDDKKMSLEEKLKQAEAKAMQQKELAFEEELKKVKEEFAKMTEMAKRVAADYQNYKRRQEEEKCVITKMANIDLIKVLLPALDNISRALKHMPEEANEKTKAWIQGIEISINQFLKTFQDFGLQEIETVGKLFNPMLHEAVMQGEGENNMILEELGKGYTLDNKVVRPAKVKMGNGTQSQNQDQLKDQPPEK